MKTLCKLTFSLWILGFATLLNAEPADNQIKGALFDIDRYEKQFSGTSSANPNTVKRTLKLLTLTRQRLDESGNKSHESWIDADSRYNRLVAHLNNLLNPAASTAAPKQQATPAPQATPVAAPTSSAPAQMISQYRIRIKKITRDLESIFQTMDQGGVQPFQDPAYVAKFEQAAQRHADSIAKYAAYSSDPDVVAANEALAKLNNMIAFGKQHAAKETNALGDVQAKLKTVNQQIRQLAQPATPQQPYQQGQIRQWLTQLAQTRKAAVEIYTPLPEIKKTAYLPNNPGTVEQGAPYDLNDVDRLERSLISLVNSIDANLKQFGENLDNQISSIRDTLSVFTKYDPANEDDQINHFLGEGRADENRARLAEFTTTVSEIAAFSKLTNAANLNERLAFVTEVQSVVDLYENNYQKARSLVRMPAAATKDSKLTDIAKKTLAGYDYVGQIERLVINTEKQHRTEETSDEKFDKMDVSISGSITLTGTKTTYFYEWDQFQVATAEPLGDKYYIFYNTLKYYTSGASTTPLNKWIISARIQGSEIPKANISK